MPAPALRPRAVTEILDGPEFSLFVVCDGTQGRPLLPAQDFKRIFDGGRGPNTGGMGSYSPLAWLPDGTVDAVMEQVGLILDRSKTEIVFNRTGSAE